MMRPDEDERLDWLDLTRRYWFTYGEPLQQRLARQRLDISAWHQLGKWARPPRYQGPGRAHASVATGETRRFAPPATPARLPEEINDGETPTT